VAQYNFKSVGKTTTQQLSEELTQTTLPIGIKTPLRLGSNDILDMNYSLADQVHDNLRNLLLTNWGERLGFYDFGGNLRPLTTEFTTQEDFDTAAIERIKNAVSRWMSYVDLENFLSEIDRTENKNTGIIRITVTYNVPALEIRDKRLQITLYVL